MSFPRKQYWTGKLLAVIVLLAACSNSDPGTEEEKFEAEGQGVFILCEGNFNAGNATLSYYDPETRKVENAVRMPFSNAPTTAS